MAEIIEGNSGSGRRKARKGFHIDMTPMVDLAFLLLTFFVLAATLAKPKALEIIYPKESPDHPTPLNMKQAITLIVGASDDKIFYYAGKFDSDTTVLHKTSLSASGFRSYLFDRNRDVIERVDKLRRDLQNGAISDSIYQSEYSNIVANKEAPFVIITPLPGARYGNVISAMDELNIADVRKRSVQCVNDNIAELYERKMIEVN